LHQSPRAWHEKISVPFQKTSLVPFLVDPNLYIFQDNGLILALAIYVDDLMLIGNCNAKLEWVHDELCSQIDMYLLALLTLYLGANFFLHYPWCVSFSLLIHSKMFVRPQFGQLHLQSSSKIFGLVVQN